MTTPTDQPAAGTPVTIDVTGGVHLRGSAWGDPAGPPVVLLHGGGQTHHAWAGTARALADRGFHATALDLRGHGDSDWPSDGDYRLEAFARDIRHITSTFATPPALVGASLGGASSLLATGEEPPCAHRALVLVDIATRMEIEGVLRIVTFMRAAPDGFATLDEAADAIGTYLPDRARPTDLTGLAKNLRQGTDGRWRWHWDPRFLTGPLTPRESIDSDRLARAARNLQAPTLLVRGRMSDLLSEAGAQEFLGHAPHAQYIDIHGAGHMVAGDRNDAFTTAVADFLTHNLEPTTQTGAS